MIEINLVLVVEPELEVGGTVDSPVKLILHSTDYLFLQR